MKESAGQREFLICFHTKHSKAQLAHANMLVGQAQCAETTVKLYGMPARATSNANVQCSSNSPVILRVWNSETNTYITPAHCPKILSETLKVTSALQKIAPNIIKLPPFFYWVKLTRCSNCCFSLSPWLNVFHA